jgi:hypothetical protein
MLKLYSVLFIYFLSSVARSEQNNCSGRYNTVYCPSTDLLSLVFHFICHVCIIPNEPH